MPGETGAPTPSVLMFCPAYASHMTPSESSGGMWRLRRTGKRGTQGGQGKAGEKKDVCGGRGQEVAEAPPRAAVDSSPGPGRVGVWAAEDNFCQQPAGSCPPPALRYAAPRPPSRGSRSSGRAVPHPGAHPPRPPASSPSGPEGATGQRGPESGPGCVGGGALLPHASCARGSAAPARAVAPSAAARLPGDRARAPGGSRAPSARGGEGGSGAGSRRKHPAT